MRAESEKRSPAAIDQLFAALRQGDRRALARAISLVEDAAPEANILLGLCREALAVSPFRAMRIGITGPAGAGKSTLVDAFTRELRSQGKRVGIIAVDPSSPFSGGAILGDRIRLADFTADAGVYMRSLASRGHLGGLAAAAEDVLTVLEAAGFETLLVESTGVGQGEVEIAQLADSVAVVLVPGMGDSIQSLKAGLLEIATVYVLNKADRPGIDQLEAEIQEMLTLSHVLSGSAVLPPVHKTTAITGAGIAELLASIQRQPPARTQAAHIPQRVGIGSPPFSNKPVLDHLGIAVRSLAASGPLYALLGASSSPVETVEHERVRVQMISVGQSRIELLEPTAPDSVIGRFLEKRGEGLHHVALRVPDLEAVVDRLRAANIRLVSATIQTGAGGHRYVFLHPASANGVLLELVESAAVESSPSARHTGAASR
jgi:LAO/AO transport system kinase